MNYMIDLDHSKNHEMKEACALEIIEVLAKHQMRITEVQEVEEIVHSFLSFGAIQPDLVKFIREAVYIRPVYRRTGTAADEFAKENKK